MIEESYKRGGGSSKRPYFLAFPYFERLGMTGGGGKAVKEDLPSPVSIIPFAMRTGT